jgi:ankyrin repeat protein
VVGKKPDPQWIGIPRSVPDDGRRHYERRRPDKFDKRLEKLRTEKGLALLAAAKKVDTAGIRYLVNHGAPVNFVDPVYHATALHYLAAYDARPALGVLLASEKCDFLIRDWEGRLPSEIAREYGRDREMAHELLIKEMRQAQAQGIDPANLYKVSARKAAP